MKNRPDYDFSKHVKVPEEWIERALAVPAALPAEPHRFSQRSRRAAAAASIVLVLGLSLSLYFVIRNINHSADVTAPIPEPTAAASDSAPPSPTDAAMIETPTSDQPSDPVPTDSATQLSPTALQPSASDPTVVTPTVPTAPTDPPTHRPTAPTEAPTQPHTDPPAQPTEPPVNTEPPSDAPQDNPMPAAECDVEVFVPFSVPIYQSCESDADETIYCRIYSEAGAVIGESDWYAPSHIAQLLWVDRTPYLYYTASLPADGYTVGQYQYVFYDSAGRTLQYGYC